MRVMKKALPARFWKRGIAYIIDSLIISFIILSPFAGFLESEPGSFFSLMQMTFTWEYLSLSLVIAILTLAYWSFLEYKFNQSIGKIFLRLKVNSNKRKLTFNQVFLRNVTKLSTILVLLDCLYILKNKKKNQRYFEKMSNTYVTEEVMVI